MLFSLASFRERGCFAMQEGGWRGNLIKSRSRYLEISPSQNGERWGGVGDNFSGRFQKGEGMGGRRPTSDDGEIQLKAIKEYLM